MLPNELIRQKKEQWGVVCGRNDDERAIPGYLAGPSVSPSPTTSQVIVR